jgi:hypothetical protein
MLRCNIPTEVVMLQEQQERERQQQQQYAAIKMLQQPLYSRKQRRYNVMKRRLRKGIPNQHQRSIVWPILCNVSTKMNASPPPGLYHTLLLEMSNHCNQEHETATSTALTPGANYKLADTATSASLTGSNNTTMNGAKNTSLTSTTGKSGTSNEIEDTTKIEMNYTKATLSSKITATTNDNNENHTPTVVRPPIQFQYTKSFRSIQVHFRGIVCSIRQKSTTKKMSMLRKIILL